ncbi:MAG: AAA family ATPase [Pseudonocardia sp.]
MSPRLGGEADKFGNRYEGAWTVRHLLYVLAGKAESVTVEDFGDLAQGVEFTYRRRDAIEVHQLKRQNGNADSWTVKSLQDKGIWDNVRHHVEAGREFHFISILPAVTLQRLADRARRADSATALVNDWLTNKGLRDAFDDLCSPAVLGAAEVSWRTLRGFWVDWPSERDIVEVNSTLAEMQLKGSTGALAAVGLGDLVVHNLGVCLDAPKIESELGKYGLHQTEARRGSAIAKQVKSATDGWAASIGRELLQPTIVSPEADKLVDLLDGADSLLLLMGAAGGGKTAVLHQVFQTLEAGATPTLGFRLDRLNSFSTTTELGNRVGLDVSPVTALATVAGDRNCVLIVDQVDAVSLASGRMPDNFDSVANLVREASAFPNMRVILACRKFDVENDYRIRELVSDKRCARVEVADLLDVQVQEAVTASRLWYGDLDNRVRVHGLGSNGRSDRQLL